MVDSIHIRLRKPLINCQQLEAVRNSITFKKEIHSERGLTTVGHYRNFQVCITPQAITLNGSLPKFLNEHNVFTLSQDEVVYAIRLLGQQLSLPIFKGEIARLDLAESVPVIAPPRKYFVSLLDTPKFERGYGKNPSKSLRYTKDNLVVAFYDKTDDMQRTPDAFSVYKGFNVVRIEMRIMNNVRRTIVNSISNLAVVHLLSPTFYQKLAHYWVEHYDAIVKKRRLYPTPALSGWKELQDHIVSVYLHERGFSQVNADLLDLSEGNRWQARTLRIVRDQLSRLYNSELSSMPNKYMAELDARVRETYTYSIATTT